MSAPTVTACGDSCVRIVSTESSAQDRWLQVQRVAAELDRANMLGIRDVITTYDAALVEFDCATVTHADVYAVVNGLDANSVAALREPREFEIPVVYGGEHGPDLGFVASHLGVSEADVVALHSATPLTMRCFGSPGGAPMLDGPAFGMPIPRLGSPRSHVPAGAIAVAGTQAVISARPAPGGWQVLGRTPVTLVDTTREPLSPFAPGDVFRFVPIDVADWDRYVGDLRG